MTDQGGERADPYLNAMLEAVKLPARVPDLDTGLADVDRDALPHGGGWGWLGGAAGEMGKETKARMRGERRVRRRLSPLCLGFPLPALGSFI